MPPSSTLTVGPAQGDLLLRTTAEGRAARMGHDLTLRVREWESVTTFEAGAPVGVVLTLDLASMEVLRGEGGLKPLSEADKRKVLAGAAKTLGNGASRFTARSVTGAYTLHGELELHGVTRPQVVQVGVLEHDASLRITGRATVRQSDFGITPYTQMMGSLVVGDLVQVHVEVVVPAPGQG